MRGIGSTFLLLSSAASASASVLAPRADDSKKCPGYKVANVEQSERSLTAQLRLAGKPCNSYGKDLEKLKLTVEYQTDSRLHVMIEDEDEDVYQVPEDVFPRPDTPEFSTLSDSMFTFSFQNEPFSFSISRKDTDEVLFNTTGSNLVFQDQYLNLRTSLPEDPNLYGLGEHTDPFRLNTTDYVRTLWNRDAYGIAPGTNLYGDHPIYVDHRGKSGTHGVFFLNSNGMDIMIDKDDEGQQYLEYNTLGGVFDFYFFSGPTPKEVAQQYAEVAGLPAMIPYWGFGLHNCRYGYEDAFAASEVVYNYSQAGIPLETFWSDIDYMDGRQIFTLDPERYPLEEVRALVDYLHDHDQHYVVMVDPAVSTKEEGNPAYPRGVEQDVFMKRSNGSLYRGDVWPGVTVYPDWFNPQAGDYWSNEFLRFFDADSGVDIDALWIDMNEASNFCVWPCTDPEGWARDDDLPPAPPPVREKPRPLPGFPPVLQPPSSNKAKRADSGGKKKGLPGRNLTVPPYEIHNEAGALSNKTIATDLIHANGLAEYDTHNLYGLMMSIASREALLKRRPGKRPLVITRSTFAGAGRSVGKWLGDNLSQWDQYRFSIAGQLAYAAIFQVPMVGSDTGGFGDNVTEALLARWATLGAFSTFYRNHNEITSISQEFYQWESVAEAARNAIDIRYKLLDYIYTAFHHQTQTGDPLLNPLFYLYPEDENTFPIELQFFYGQAILVSPVTEENSTSVDIYLPDDIFYDYKTGSPVRGKGDKITLDDVPFTEIPLHIRGGTIIPRRAESANTTTALRNKPFEIVVAPGLDGTASGSLYIDDGESLEQEQTLEITFSYADGVFKMEGKFGSGVVADQVKIANIWVLGQEKEPKTLSRDGEKEVQFKYHADVKTVTGQVELPFTGPAEVRLG